MSDLDKGEEKKQNPKFPGIEILPSEYWEENRVVDMLKEGYEIAFNSISKKYGIILRDFAISFIEDKAITEDICVRLFTEMWYNRFQFTTVSDIEQFLFQNIRNGCIDQLTHQKNPGPKTNEFVSFLEKSQPRDLYELDVWGEFKKLLRERKDQLPPLHRKIVDLNFEGRDDNEIAGILGLSRNAVDSYRAFIEKWLGYSLDSNNWLTSFKKGKKEIWDAIYGTHKNAIHTYAMNLTKNNVREAEDLTADAFAKLWEKKSKIQNEAHIRPWLYRVLKNTFLDEQDKGNRNYEFLESLDYKGSFVDFGGIVELEMLHADLVGRLLDEIELLPTRVKAVFKLSYYHKKTTKEIAILLGIKEDAVARDKLKAKQLLKSKILKGNL